MQALLSKYDINDETFYKILHESHGIIAGSAALCALVGGFESGDIDIWVDGSKLASDEKSKLELSYAFNKYFESKGYKEYEIEDKHDLYVEYYGPGSAPAKNEKERIARNEYIKSTRKIKTDTSIVADVGLDEYLDNAYMNDSNRFHKIISRIARFENKKEQHIQVIWTKPTVSVMDAIKSFDLSVSATWFVPSDPSPTNGYADCEGKIYTYDPINTLNRIMYRLDDDNERLSVYKRIAKYKSYGFKLRHEKKVIPEELIASLIVPSFTI
jgi:hypothetical protein